MKFTEFATYVRYCTRTNTTTFSDEEMLSIANVAKDNFATQIADVNEDFFALDYIDDLVADQREYPLPGNVLQIKRLEAKLDGTAWKNVFPIDYNVGDFTSDEAGILRAFSGKKPRYELFGNMIRLLTGDAIIAVAGGLDLKVILFPADFTSLASTNDMSVDPSATSFGFPKHFHELLARRVSIQWKSTRDKPIPLTESERQFDVDLSRKLASIQNYNLDESVLATIPDDGGDTGEDF